MLYSDDLRLFPSFGDGTLKSLNMLRNIALYSYNTYTQCIHPEKEEDLPSSGL
jgi:hypothetical protein